MCFVNKFPNKTIANKTILIFYFSTKALDWLWLVPKEINKLKTVIVTLLAMSAYLP